MKTNLCSSLSTPSPSPPPPLSNKLFFLIPKQQHNREESTELQQLFLHRIQNCEHLHFVAKFNLTDGNSLEEQQLQPFEVRSDRGDEGNDKISEGG